MTPAERTRWICEQAHEVGCELCGVVSLASTSGTIGGSAQVETPELARLPEWLARGYAGEMSFLNDARRADLALVLEGARSLIVVALNYNTDHAYSTDAYSMHTAAVGTGHTASDDAPRGWISRYAWGDDYHEILGERLNALVTAMREQFAEAFDARSYVDTGPVIERIAAKYAGLGWLAKNTCLIHERVGSWIFLGVIVTTLELAPSLVPGESPAPDLCGNCTLCIDACPTQAFPQPYVLDARRCISYLTIELRGPIPEELRAQMGRAVIGCDICQDVCPWNRKAPATRLAAFEPRKIFSHRPNEGAANAGEGEQHSLFSPGLEWLASLNQEEFSRIFRGSAVKRAKWRGLVRNACVALGNSRLARDSEAYRRVSLLLSLLADSDDAIIAEHARWALARLALREPLVGFSS